MFDLKSYIIGMVCMGLWLFLIGQLYPILKNISQVNRGKIFTDSYDSTIILIGYIKGRSRKYDKLGA